MPFESEAHYAICVADPDGFRCFLYAVLKIIERCVRDLSLRKRLVDKAWSVYEVATRGPFSQRLRRFREWGMKQLTEGPLREAVLSLAAKDRALRAPTATVAPTARPTRRTGS